MEPLHWLPRHWLISYNLPLNTAVDGTEGVMTTATGAAGEGLEERGTREGLGGAVL